MYYKCVKFHKNPISCLGGVALTRYMDRRTDGQGDSYIPPQTLFAGLVWLMTNEDTDIVNKFVDFIKNNYNLRKVSTNNI